MAAMASDIPSACHGVNGVIRHRAVPCPPVGRPPYASRRRLPLMAVPYSLAHAAFIFFISALAETNRPPFDLPEAESELVAGFHSEYSSMKFAMFFLGEYVGITLISAMIVTLFFGGWLGPWLPGVVWFGLKTFLFLVVFVLARASLPRPRYDQLMAFGWKAMLPLALANLWATGAVVLWRSG